MTATNNTEFAAMGKEELRAACRVASISYGKLNNDGMRAALTAHYAVTEDEVEDEAVIAGPNPFAALAGKIDVPAFKGTVTKSSDGKKVDDKVEAPKAESRPRVIKPAAPFVPKVVRKDYKIQKDREVRIVNGKSVKRPSEGTVCGAVWAEFDKNPKITAGELHTLADSKGWNRTNVSCEFYTWRKFMGITGRQA